MNEPYQSNQPIIGNSNLPDNIGDKPEKCTWWGWISHDFHSCAECLRNWFSYVERKDNADNADRLRPD